jgi:hypothetical protein
MLSMPTAPHLQVERHGGDTTRRTGAIHLQPCGEALGRQLPAQAAAVGQLTHQHRDWQRTLSLFRSTCFGRVHRDGLEW